MRSITPPEAQQWRLVLLQTNNSSKDRINKRRVYTPERRASSESANNCHPFVRYPQSAKRHRAVKPYTHRVRSGTMASSHFQHLTQWEVVVCKECRYAVWPRQVVGHLTNRQHRMPRKQAVGISDEIEQWHGIAQFSGEFKIPKYVEAVSYTHLTLPTNREV